MVTNLWLAVFMLSAVFAEIPEEEDVLVLDESNFSEALDLYPDLLVEFYAPWCGHCKKLAPEYAKAAAKLKANDPPIRIAKVDATQAGSLAQKYGVQGYPTLKYFINKQPTDYTGGRTEDTIVPWVLKRMGPAVTVVSTVEDVKKTTQDKKVVAVLFAQKDASEYEAFEFTAKAFDSVDFLLCTEEPKEFDATAPAIILFRKFDEPQLKYSGSFNTVELSAFIENNRRPFLMPFDDDAMEYIFQKRNDALLFFRGASDSEKFDGFLTELAKELKGELAITYIDLNDASAQRVGDFFGVKVADMPKAIITTPSTMEKYKIDGTVDEAHVRKLISDFRAKALQPFLKSEDLPADPFDNEVRVLVGNNFESIVYDSSKDVLVEFYAPWCGHCKKLAPDYEKLANEFKDVSSVIIAKIDYTANEVKGQNIRGYPTIKYFTANNKKGLDFEGDRSFQDLKDYVVKNAAIPIQTTTTESRETGDL